MNENIVLSGAEQDQFGVYRRAEHREEGRGDRMNADFLHALDLLAHNPLMGSPYFKTIRKLILRDWGIGIYYSVEGHRNMILAVQHLRQSPKKIHAILRSRMPE
jgi:plasmid stabilization system protein ParE